MERTMRKEAANKQSKFKHYILTPIRILKGVAGCAGGFGGCGAGVGAGSAVQISQYPETKSFNLNSSRENENDDERQRELLRTVPIVRNAGNETRAVMHGEKMVTIRNNVGNETRVVMHRQRQPNVRYKYNRTKMSYYTDEVRKMGRIDEDEPCFFEKDQNADSKAHHHLLYLYPRSRTYVVNRRAVYYQ